MPESLPLFLFLSVGAIALFSFVAVASWSDNRRREREAYYNAETLRKIAEAQGTGAASALEYLREQETNRVRQAREGLKLGGLVISAVGLGFMVFMRAMAHHPNAYLIGAVPVLVGVALLAYVYLLSPKP